MRNRIYTLAVAVLIGLLLLPGASAQAQAGNTWQVWFFPNTEWAGVPANQTMTTSALAFDFGHSAPPGLPVDNWTMRATSSAWLAAGQYNFVVQADDEFVLLIDGVIHASTIGQRMSGKTITVPVWIGENRFYNLQVDFREFTGLAYIFVNWQMTQGAPPTPVPPVAPVPPNTPLPSARSITTDFGNFTPCIEQRIHQKHCFESNGEWNAPNFGSIEMEPPIVFWERCTQDQIQTRRLFVNQPVQPAKCSKTQAGWFPM